MLKPRSGGTFKKEYALAKKRGRDMSKIDAVITMLIKEQPMPPGALRSSLARQLQQLP